MATTISNATTVPQQKQRQPAAEPDYAFSSAAFRKKKKSKKFRNKKIVTKETVSGRGPNNQPLSRSLSTSALVRPTSTTTALLNPKLSTKSRLIPSASATSLNPASSMAKPPPSSATPTANAVFSSNGSPVSSRRKLFGVPREDRDERELDITSVVKKPWESDIRKKHKTECGNRILRDGPSSRTPINGYSARRCRSLSTSRHRSPRSFVEKNRFSAHSSGSGSEDDPCDDENNSTDNGKDELHEEVSELDDAEKSYEKYRQFLASTRSTDSDESFTRESALPLKQKLGAAPSLNFSYRYSEAADELLGLNRSCSNTNTGDKITGEEEIPGDEPKSDSSKVDNLSTEKDAEATSEPPVFVGDVLHDDKNNENNFDRDSGDDQDDIQASSPAVESPLQSLSSETLRCSPSFTDSPQPTTHSTKSTTSNEEGLPPPSSPQLQLQQQQQQQQQAKEENEVKETPVTALSSGEENPCDKKGTISPSDVDRDKANEDNRILNDNASKKTSVAKLEDEHHMVPSDLNTSTNVRDGEDTIDMPGYISDSSSDCYNQEDAAVHHEDQTKPVVVTNDQNEENLHCPPSNESNIGSENKNSDCTTPEECDPNHPPFLDSEDKGVSTSLDTKRADDVSDVDESSPSTMMYNDDNLDTSEEQSLTEDTDYPEEDRELLSLMYHIHTS